MLAPLWGGGGGIILGGGEHGPDQVMGGQNGGCVGRSRVAGCQPEPQAAHGDGQLGLLVRNGREGTAQDAAQGLIIGDVKLVQDMSVVGGPQGEHALKKVVEYYFLKGCANITFHSRGGGGRGGFITMYYSLLHTWKVYLKFSERGGG